ncbi:MAG: MurR/RpiR family transcriptional regulator [Pseudomonadota bacterium]
MSNAPSIAEKIRANRDVMTRSEAQLVEVILDEYPVSGLCSITELAEKAAVSSPTVGRLLQKLGYGGYGEFQAALRVELSEMISNPISKRVQWKSDLPEEHILSRYAALALDNQRSTLDGLDPAEFDVLLGLLADPRRRVFLAGGRITGVLAQYFYLHLQMIRPEVRILPMAGSWPHHLLDLRDGDVFVAFDVRRYENTTMMMAQMCHERGAEVALFTDQWRSPIRKVARLTFAGRISVPSAWDSMGSLMLLIECTIAALQELLWDSVQERTNALESAFDRTRLFRKFG